MKTVDYFAQNIEISNYSSEEEWEDSIELANQMIAELPELYMAVLVRAKNVNWLGQGGWRMFEVPRDDPSQLWSSIAGWRDAEWTLRINKIPDNVTKGFSAMAYSHDTPTGGERAVKFLDASAIYKMLIEKGWTFWELVKEFGEMGHVYTARPSKSDLIATIQNEMGFSDIEELLSYDKSSVV